MNLKLTLGGVALLAILAGIALWLGCGAPSPISSSEVSPAVLYATNFSDAEGRTQSLDRYRGKLLVLNFWATWCAPCREEMPAFARLQKRWAAHNVQFVGIADDDPERVRQFGKDLGIDYPLLTGGEEVGVLSKLLGNRMSVLPHTVILDRTGRVLEERVGTYSESELQEKLTKYSGE